MLSGLYSQALKIAPGKSLLNGGVPSLLVTAFDG